MRAILLALTLFALVAYAVENPVALRNEGLRLAHLGKWEDAKAAFERAWVEHEDAVTAYLLAVVYSKLGDASDTLQFAQIALHRSPPLSKSLRQGAEDLSGWAKAIQDHPEMKVRFSLSDETRKSKDLEKLAAMADVYSQKVYDATARNITITDSCGGAWGPERSRCLLEHEADISVPVAPKVPVSIN